MPKITKFIDKWELEPIAGHKIVMSKNQVWDLIFTLTQWRDSHIDMKIGDKIEVPKEMAFGDNSGFDVEAT